MLLDRKKPVIACIHLLPLPGAPRYNGDLQSVYETALQEADIYESAGVDALIVENFRDMPFYPDQVPAETIATLAAITREITNQTKLPIGVNVLRNDAEAAMAIASVVGARFIRVNVHLDAVVADQGIIEGKAFKTMRLRHNLRSDVLLFADVGVKHAAPLGDRGLALQTQDLTDRGLADAIIVSGTGTGASTRLEDIELVGENTNLPVVLGSGTTIENLSSLHARADGFIVGSTFKKAGQVENPLDPERISAFMRKKQSLDETDG